MCVVVFLIYPKHKETTEDISMLVSIYKYAMTSSVKTKLVRGHWKTCKSLVPTGRVNQSSFTNTCWRYSFKVRILGVKEQTGRAAASDRGVGTGQENELQESEFSLLGTLCLLKLWATHRNKVLAKRLSGDCINHMPPTKLCHQNVCRKENFPKYCARSNIIICSSISSSHGNPHSEVKATFLSDACCVQGPCLSGSSMILKTPTKTMTPYMGELCYAWK